MKVDETLNFLASVIKSGEEWTDVCEIAYREALADIAGLRQLLKQCQNDRAQDQHRLFHYEHLLAPKPMKTAPRDGTPIVLITTTGVVSATYDKGKGWVDNYEGPQEYWGPQWVAYDDAFTLDIEETPEGEYCAGALGWLPMITIEPTPESSLDTSRSSFGHKDDHP
jgi:hypothetical protein